MDNANTRKEALRIECALLNKIALLGVSTIAKSVGVNASQITRWKESLIPKMSMLLAVLEVGIADEEMSELARRLAGFLSKEKGPEGANFGA